jgi:PAS domain S-box-containing protein
MAQRVQDLAEMLDLAHDAVLARGLDGAVTYWNRGCEELYGQDREAVLGRNADDLLESRFSASPEIAKAELLAAGRWEGEVARKVRGGTEAIIAVRWSLRRDATGQPVEILEMGRDVTAARRAEEAVRRSEFRYRNVFQAMAVAFWEVDFTRVGLMLGELKTQGVTDYRAHVAANPGLVRQMMEASRVIDVNEKTLQLFNGSRDQLQGSVSPFWTRASEPVFAESIFAVLERKPHYESEAKFRTLDGREFDALFTCCFPREGVARGTILVGIVDITDRLKAQDELHKVQAELAHAARVSTLGELTASIAHEVNQPLAAIVTNGEASLRWLNRLEPDLDEARSAIGRMIAEGQRASDIIARIRSMSMKTAPEKEALALAGLIEDAALLVRRELATHGVGLSLSLAADLPQVLGDRVQLQQVIVNLMMNAIQAMAHHDEHRSLAVAAAAAGGEVVVQVADTGPGVAPDDAGRLFDAFFTTKPTGMGMGLSICKSIVEAHGGRIWVKPSATGGSVFSFALPVAAD